MPRVVHFEIPVDEPERAVEFYRNAFGWELNRFGDVEYWLATTGPADEPGADGALFRRTDERPATVVVVGVTDIDASLARVEDAGGRVVERKQPVPGVGWAAYVHDPEGNVVGLFQDDPSAPGAPGADG